MPIKVLIGWGVLSMHHILVAIICCKYVMSACSWYLWDHFWISDWLVHYHCSPYLGKIINKLCLHFYLMGSHVKFWLAVVTVLQLMSGYTKDLYTVYNLFTYASCVLLVTMAGNENRNFKQEMFMSTHRKLFLLWVSWQTFLFCLNYI